MKQAFLITGTDTGIGKSVVTAGLAVYFQAKGISVGVLKPLQSGAVKKGDHYESEDALFAMTALGRGERWEEAAPFCFPGEMAPYYAMRQFGQQITLDELTVHYQRLQAKYDLLLLEGAGGLCVPYLGEDFLVADLAKVWSLPLILVARGNLGTINHTVLSIEYAKQRNLALAGFILNNVFSDAWEAAHLHAGAIERMTGVRCLGILPKIADLCMEKCRHGNLLETIQKYGRLDGLWRE